MLTILALSGCGPSKPTQPTAPQSTKQEKLPPEVTGSPEDAMKVNKAKR